MTYMMAFLVAGIAGLTAAVGVAFYMSSRGRPGGYASAVEGRSPPPGRMPSDAEDAARELRDVAEDLRSAGMEHWAGRVEDAVIKWDQA